MKIDKISAENFSLRSFSHTLAPLTIIHGSNASGKSTIKDSILLAATGKHADAPASAAGIMETFATGPSMTVAIQAAGRTFSRTWSRTGKNVKATTAGDDTLGTSIAPSFFAGSAFLRAKPAERANMLRAAYPSENDPKEAVLAAITKANGLIRNIAPALSFDAWVEEYLEVIKTEAQAHRATEKRMKGVIQGLEQLAEDDYTTPVTAEAIKAANEAVAAIRLEVGIAINKVKNHEANSQPWPDLPEHPKAALQATLEAQQADLASIKAQIANHEATNAAIKKGNQDALAQYQDATKRYEAAHENYQESLAESSKLNIRSDEDAKTVLELLLRDGQKTPADHAAILASLREKAAEAEALAAKSQRQLAEAKGKLDNVLAHTSNQATCQQCGSHREHWDTEIIEAMRVLREQREKDHADAEAIALRSSKVATELRAQLARMEDEAQRISKSTALLKFATLLAAAPKPEGAPVPNKLIDNDSREEESYDLECAIQDTKEALEAYRIRSEQEEIAAKITELNAAIASGEERLAAARAKHDELAQAYEAQNSKRENQAKTEQANKELQEATEALAAADATRAIIQDTAKEEALKVLEPLLKAAAMFTDGILTPPITNTGLAIGRWHGATWQPINRLSGAEQAMVTAALGAALATGEASKIVIIDEFSVLDDAWKPLFLANLRKAQEAGIIEQAIILDNRKTEAEGWTTIEVSA